MSSKEKRKTVYRDSVDGRFITKSEAVKRRSAAEKQLVSGCERKPDAERDSAQPQARAQPCFVN
jgi:hypothetical protein